MYFQSLRYSYIGLFFGVAVVLGFAVGGALDRRFHTGSWLTLVGVLFGVASGFNELLRMARRYQKELARDAKNEPPSDRQQGLASAENDKTHSIP